VQIFCSAESLTRVVITLIACSAGGWGGVYGFTCQPERLCGDGELGSATTSACFPILTQYAIWTYFVGQCGVRSLSWWISGCYNEIAHGSLLEYWNLLTQCSQLSYVFHIACESSCEENSMNYSTSSFTGFHNPLAGFSLLILEVSRSHTRTHHSR
jgi:hypothetical protein